MLIDQEPGQHRSVSVSVRLRVDRSAPAWLTSGSSEYNPPLVGRCAPVDISLVDRVPQTAGLTPQGAARSSLDVTTLLSMLQQPTCDRLRE